MKSPITGKEMSLRKEVRPLTFRKEEFKVIYHFYLCIDSGEQFTTSELDDININQLHNLYRERYNIPFTDEILAIRKQYNLSAQKMSESLGFGVNAYRNYEHGEIPNESNGKLIRLAEDPKIFKTIVEESAPLDNKIKASILMTIDSVIMERKMNRNRDCFEAYLLGNSFPNESSGYSKPSLQKFTEMVVFFAEKISPFKVKLNKLLFYADFANYKFHCHSISGLKYAAINYGPVPDNYNAIFEYITKNGIIDIKTTELPDGYTGEQFRNLRPFDPDVFSDDELRILQAVTDRFSTTSGKDLATLSHEEFAWVEHQENKSIISYSHAFDLIAL
jgi:putative zinc finger/helix-turn-helix YgiT family protein